MKTILLLVALFSSEIIAAQLNPIFSQSDIACTKNFKALVEPYVSYDARSNKRLLPQMVTKSETLKSFIEYHQMVRHEPVPQFKPDDVIVSILAHIDTVANSVLSKTSQNIFMVKTNGNGNPDNIICWVTFTWKSNLWEFDAESFLTKPLAIKPGDIIFRPTN